MESLDLVFKAPCSMLLQPSLSSLDAKNDGPLRVSGDRVWNPETRETVLTVPGDVRALLKDMVRAKWLPHDVLATARASWVRVGQARTRAVQLTVSIGSPEIPLFLDGCGPGRAVRFIALFVPEAPAHVITAAFAHLSEEDSARLVTLHRAWRALDELQRRFVAAEFLLASRALRDNETSGFSTVVETYFAEDVRSWLLRDVATRGDRESPVYAFMAIDEHKVAFRKPVLMALNGLVWSAYRPAMGDAACFFSKAAARAAARLVANAALPRSPLDLEVGTHASFGYDVHPSTHGREQHWKTTLWLEEARRLLTRAREAPARTREAANAALTKHVRQVLSLSRSKAVGKATGKAAWAPALLRAVSAMHRDQDHWPRGLGPGIFLSGPVQARWNPLGPVILGLYEVLDASPARTIGYDAAAQAARFLLLSDDTHPGVHASAHASRPFSLSSHSLFWGPAVGLGPQFAQTADAVAARFLDLGSKKDSKEDSKEDSKKDSKKDALETLAALAKRGVCAWSASGGVASCGPAFRATAPPKTPVLRVSLLKPELAVPAGTPRASIETAVARALTQTKFLDTKAGTLAASTELETADPEVWAESRSGRAREVHISSTGSGWRAMWSENRLWQHLSLVLLWPIVSDGCRTQAQRVLRIRDDVPMDYGDAAFAARRAEDIAAGVSGIATSSSEDLVALVRARAREMTSGPARFAKDVRWDLFPVETCASVVSAVSPQALSAIVARILAHRRLHGTGLPDLLLWRKRPVDSLGGAPHEFRFVEVKGPGDALHPNQVEWIEFMETVFPGHVAVAVVTYDA